MADLENIRGNYLTQELGNFPLDCEYLDYLQQRDDLAAVLGNIAGDRVILQGLESDGSGIVFLKTRLCPKGEILPVEKGSGNYLVVTETDIAVNFSAVDKFPKAHTKRTLVYSASQVYGKECYSVSGFWNLRNNRIIYESLLAEIQVRENADNSLRDSVNALSNSLSSEQTARDAAVQSLKETLLQQIRSEVILASGRAANSLSAEVTALNKRIADLESALSKQIANAQNTADSAADGLASTQYVDSRISTLTDKINNEITQRTADDNTEKAERKAADKTITARVDSIEKSIVPKGVILIWSGFPTDIPKGWALCNGQNGRPDLRGRFVLGACPQEDVNLLDYTHRAYGEWPHNIDGEDHYSITLTTENLPKHTHTAESRITGYKTQESGSSDKIWVLHNGTDVNLDSTNFFVSTNIGPTGEGKPYGMLIMPPYYALCYIIKL